MDPVDSQEQGSQDVKPRYLSRMNSIVEPGDIVGYAAVSSTAGNKPRLSRSSRFPSLRFPNKQIPQETADIQLIEPRIRRETHVQPIEALSEEEECEQEDTARPTKTFDESDSADVPDEPLASIPSAQPQSKTSVEDGVPADATTNVQRWSMFSQRTKLVVIVYAAIAGCFNPFTQTIFYPSIGTISGDLKIGVWQVNLTVTAYAIFAAISPMFLAAISDVKGRRPGYVIGFVIYVLSNLGLALNDTYPGLFIFRCLQSCGSSGLAALRSGTINDVVTRAEIGKYVAITSISAMIAPSVGPICGGLLAQHLGWHAIFWFLLGLGALFFVPLVLFFPETCRAVVGNGSVPPPWWNRSLGDIKRKSRDDLEQSDDDASLHTGLRAPRKVNFLGAFTLMADLETALILLFVGVINLGISAQTTSLTTQFEAVYHLNPSEQGLLYLPQAVGSLVAAFTNSKVLDMSFGRYARKAGISVDKKVQVDFSDMNIEKARLDIALPTFTLAGLFLFLFGWAVEWQVKIAGPIMLLTLFSIMIGIGFGTLTVLLVDIHQGKAATASSSTLFAKSAFGAVGSAIVEPMINWIGNGWTFTVFGALYIAVLPGIMYVRRHGIRLRATKRQNQDEVANGNKKPQSSNKRNHRSVESSVRFGLFKLVRRGQYTKINNDK